jgi:serine/threonine-protein kinase RsbW
VPTAFEKALRKCGLDDRANIVLRHRLVLSSTREAVNLAVQDLTAVLRRMFPEDDFLADLEIAIREALANAAFHGNRSSDSKTVFLRCYAVPSRGVLVVVRDQGPGFEPDDVPDPRQEDRLMLHHGRGIFLMRRLLDQVEYRKSGTEVVLLKSC